jgi:glycosyltransferase involved in cell wall biosynthesis
MKERSSIPISVAGSPRSRRAPRLLIVEEGLRSLGSGHWYEYIKAIVEGCRSEGVEVELLAHKDAEPKVLETLRARAVLNGSAWEGADNQSAWKRYWKVLRHNFNLSRDVGTFLAGAEPFDVILAPTNLAHHVLGWHRVARRFGRSKFNRLVLIFVNTPGRRQADGSFAFPANTRFMKAVLKRMERSQKIGLLTLVAETQRAAEHFKAFCGLDFILYPHVVSLPLTGQHPSLQNGREATFGSLGFARAEKGSELLQQAAMALLNQPNGVAIKFVMQWGKDFRNGSGGIVTRPRELLNHPHVKFFDDALNTEEYQALLRRLDGLVLPYRCRSYYDRVSRVAIEAACVGLPFIYPRNSWLEDLAKNCGAGVGFEDGNAEDLMRAMRELAHNVAELKSRAARRSALARHYHSPKRFKKCLFGEADDFDGQNF